MWNHLLFAIDRYESGQTALGFTAGLARATGSDVRVLHIRELSKWARVPPLETPDQADRLVAEAVEMTRSRRSATYDVRVTAGERVVALFRGLWRITEGSAVAARGITP